MALCRCIDAAWVMDGAWLSEFHIKRDSCTCFVVRFVCFGENPWFGCSERDNFGGGFGKRPRVGILECICPDRSQKTERCVFIENDDANGHLCLPGVGKFVCIGGGPRFVLSERHGVFGLVVLDVDMECSGVCETDRR